MHTRKTMTGMLAAALLITTLPAVAAAQIDLDETPEGVVWTLTSAAGQDVPAEVNANLFMEGGEANGNGGCNAFFGSYELDGDSLMFAGEVGSTLAICAEPVQSVEDAYLPALGAVASWAISGDQLSLSDASGAEVLTFIEPTVDLTLTDVDALLTELTRLDDRITKTRHDVRQLNVPKTQKHVDENAVAVAAVAKTVQNQNVPGLRQRVIANEELLGELTDRFTNLRSRVRDLEQRVRALENE
jgi:heat shock protein HslJ